MGEVSGMFRIVRGPVVLRDGIARHRGALVVCVVALFGACREARPPRPAERGTEAEKPLAMRLDGNYGRRQLSFEPNRGQVDARVNFVARGGGYSLFLQPTQAVISLSQPSHLRARTEGIAKPAAWPRDPTRASKSRTDVETSIMAMRLVGANAASSVVGESPLPGKVNYYIGNDPKRWHENIPTFGRVRYSGVYPGIDLVYYGTEGQLEYDFIVAPGADPTQIRVAFDGAQPKLDANGDIVLARGNAEIHLRNLTVYQQKAGGRESVAGRFALSSDNQVRFAVGDYDRSRALVVDPTVVYSTYLAGSAEDEIYGLAVDSMGSAVAVGATTSTDFPVTSGAYQTTNPYPGFDGAAFITKLSPDGSSLVFSTYLGGHATAEGDSSSDAFGVAVDPLNNIYVGGKTMTAAFPTTAGAFQPALAPYANNVDGFVTKLTATGTLVYSTYIGGDGSDYVIGIAVDAAGDAHITGETMSVNTNPPRPTVVLFPTTPSAYQGPFDVSAVAPNVPHTVFLAELNSTGTQLLYSSLLEATTCDPQCPDGSACSSTGLCVTGSCNANCLNDSFSNSVAIGNGGIAYIGGWTYQPNFPTTAGALQTVARPYVGPTGFVAAFDPSKSGAASLVYSTFLGGAKISKTYDGEAVTAIAADADGNVYATGHTSSIDFPTTRGSFATACTSDPSATHCGAFPFVTKLDPTGSKLIYSTFILNGGDVDYQIAIDAARNAYVLGRGTDTFIDPVSQTGGMSIQTLSADGSKELFSTRFNSEVNAPPTPNGFVVDKSGNIYVASINGNGDLTTTPGAFQATNPPPAGRNGYVVKISPIGGAAGASGVGGAAGGGGGTGGVSGAAGSNAGAGGRGGGAGRGPIDASVDGLGDGAVFRPPGQGSGSSGGGCGGGCGVASNGEPTWAVGYVILLVMLSRRRRRR